jgi:hypothetical protein
MWHITEIEELLKLELDTLGSKVLDHNKYYQQYDQVKNYMCNQIYSEIKATEPDLTDHGETHIKNVLLNAYTLIKYSLDGDQQYSPLDLYVLCTSILIHDIGNLHGRNGHEKTLVKTYNSNTAFSNIENSEKKVISSIATSHGGEEGAISELTNHEHIEGKQIQNKCIAGVLRFADELAEGPQRTSSYRIDNDLIEENSLKYHLYAEFSTAPVINNDVVLLKYDIQLDRFTGETISDFLILLYSRIYKLNRERINCGIHSKHIQKIKKVAITIRFYENKESLEPLKNIKKQLVEFELNNLNCNKINKEEITKQYIDELMISLQQYIN